MTGPSDVRRAGADDVPALAETLARAFDDDPMTRYLFPSDRPRAKGLVRYFSLLLGRAFLPAGEVWTNDECTGGAIWSPPSARRPTARDLLRLAPMLTVLRARAPRAVGVIRAVEAKHPRTPHWYLAVLGTDPAEQGKGVGSRLMAPVLERCDDDGIGAYLESSKESNVPFYRRHGFDVTEVLQPPMGAPPLWLMWREPRPS